MSLVAQIECCPLINSYACFCSETRFRTDGPSSKKTKLDDSNSTASSTSTITSLKNLTPEQIHSKRVIMRVDFNVPMSDGKITNHQRINAALPSIRHVLKHGAHSIVLISHLGRPKERKIAKLSLVPVALYLRTQLQRPVTFLNDCIGADVKRACSASSSGGVILLENIRFHPEEEGKGVDASGSKLTPNPAQI